METLHPTYGIRSDSNASGYHSPATPPETPSRIKLRFDRAASPASSIHPFETSSPKTKNAKRPTSDSLRVEELVEGDLGYLSDIDVVYPEETEEVGSNESDDASGDSATDESDSGIARRLSRLACRERQIAEEKEDDREDRQRNKKTSDQVFKRSHSTSIKGDADVMDVDAHALDDHDCSASARRLRRRVRNDNVKAVFEGHPHNESDSSEHSPSARRRRPIMTVSTPPPPRTEAVMDVDAMG